MYGEIGEECWASLCHKPSTHTVTMKAKLPSGEIETATVYCLDDALYFAAWLPYCYPDQYTLISINPPADEFFGR